MTKEELLGLGIGSQAAESLWGSYSELEKENGALKKAASDKEKILKECEAARAEAESLKQQIRQLQEEAQRERTAHSAEISTLKLSSEVEKGLICAGARNLKAVGSLLDREQLSLDESGSLTGLDRQLEALKQSDPYLFKASEETVLGGLASFAPEEGLDEETEEPDFSLMTYSQITDYLRENRE
ncbi:MAG: phage scaffolding protein [Firmicutes bacterium]|nr:phage scaffolding protein [[Eubacterium] siraeum]MCM1487302.1 phage scaffolding protein [Bacillota bacterium]